MLRIAGSSSDFIRDKTATLELLTAVIERFEVR